MATTFDAIVIGTGQSGPALAARLTGAGLKTAIIERKLFGGTCVNVGCIPTKTLVASARAAHMARRGSDFGVVIGGEVAMDMKRVKARKDEVVRQSNEGVTNWLKNMKNLTVFEGHGSFEGADSVRVNGEVLEAERFFINVGARGAHPRHRRPRRRRVPDQLEHDGCGHAARASGGDRRRLYRSRIRPDVPPFREPRERRPYACALDSAR